jgi:hypothetical protein
MSDKLRAEGEKLGEIIASAPSEVREEINRKQKVAADVEHASFKEAFDQGNCYLCGDALTSFDESKPCAHWLLNPTGFRKKQHFAKVTEKYGFHQLQSFLRWIANEDGFAKNINDMADEGTGKLREVTIRYKDYIWSFSCTQNDFMGHGSGTHQTPHYHFQMRQGPRSVINFNDFHVPFSDADIHEISAEMANPKIKRRWGHGEGMNSVFQPDIIEAMLDGDVVNSSGEGLGEFKFDHIIEADEGTSMNGDDIQALFQESKDTGVPVAVLLRKGRIPNAKVRTIVTPGPGVVEQKSRSGRGGKKILGDEID